VLDGVISVDETGIYKPAPRVYALAVERLGVAPRSIAFVSANAWDAAAAQAVGFTALWINRAGTPIERHAAPPAFGPEDRGRQLVGRT
jgi:2-haloacid dehalogenase